MRPNAPRRGVALLLALLVLGVAGTFLVAGFRAARATAEAHRLALRTAQLDGEVDLAVTSLMATWNSEARSAQGVGVTQAVPADAQDAAAVSRARLTRVSSRVYLATVRLRDRADTTIAVGASVLLRVEAPVFPAFAAGITDGDVRVDGMFQSLPPDPAALAACGASFAGWNPLAVAPGHVAPPPYLPWAPAANDSTYRVFGGVTAADLLARATLDLPSGVPVPTPTASIVRARGDLDLAGGPGEGILVVEGRLRISGPVDFRGVIVALGGFEAASPGASVNGLLLVSGGSPRGILVKSNSYLLLRHDPCVVARVAWRAGRVRPLVRRGRIPIP